MPKVDLPCPECGRLLRLPDDSLLGRKGKCSKCGHKFILRDPKAPLGRFKPQPPLDVHFESVDETASAEPADDSPRNRTAGAPVPEHVGGQQVAAAPALSSADGVPAAAASDANPLDLLTLEAESDAESLARHRQRTRAARRRRNVVIAGSALALAGIGLALFFSLAGKRRGSSTKIETSGDVASADDVESTVEDEVSTGGVEKRARPPEPITLKLVPEGARIIVHLRPAELWQAGGTAEEFRACLGPLGTWLENAIKTHCLLEPSRIEEVLFVLIPVSRDTFETALVVRTTAGFKKSELIEKDLGELVDQPRPHYVGRERAWLIFDARTFACAPRSMVQSLLESADEASVTSEGIQTLLPRTDRRNHFTLVCDLEDLRLGSKTIAPENAQNLLEAIVDFFGDHVETVAWSVHLGEAGEDDRLTSDLLVRNRSSRSALKLHDDLKKKLSELPERVLDLVYRTNPRSIGEKKVVGRLPIMTKIVERSTEIANDRRLVTMRVELPERAGPNLALATLLTWNQTTLPDFGKSSSAPSGGDSSEEKLPNKIADRLKKRISVDYRREFMAAAIAYVEGETGVKIKLDGPGMKEVGITQNMYQSFAMENVPATAVLHKIIVENTGNKLVLIVDEKNKVATVTSITAAENKKLTPFPLEPAPK